MILAPKYPLMLEYTTANESIESIIAGMDIKKEDRILAVCGSGDQAFALLEYAREVVAVDYNPVQIAYAQERKQKLQQWDVEEFMGISFKWRTRYFKKKGRLERIRKKLDALSFLEGEIFSMAQNEGRKFNKLYLSNAISYQSISYKEQEKLIADTFASLNSGTLVYMLPFGFTFYYLEPHGLELVENLTASAQKLANRTDGYLWSPMVCRKMERTKKRQIKNTAE